MNMTKILGGFYCPHCKELNLCDCKTCKRFYDEHGIGEMEYCIWTDGGNGFICAYCDKPFSPDESLDAEFEIIKNAGHFSFIDQTEEFIKKLGNFIS